jgi:hypothetical protein
MSAPPAPEQCRHAPTLGRASPRGSRRMVPAYSLRETPRRWSAGITSHTNPQSYLLDA